MKYDNTVFCSNQIREGWANVYRDSNGYYVGAAWSIRMDADPDDGLVYRIRVIPKTRAAT